MPDLAASDPFGQRPSTREVIVIGRREFVLGAAATGVLMMQPRFGYANASHSPCLIWPRVIKMRRPVLRQELRQRVEKTSAV